MKQNLYRFIIRVLKATGLHKVFLKAPAAHISVRELLEKDKSVSVTWLEETVPLTEAPPIIIGHKVSERFTRHFHRNSKEAFVLLLPGGKVLGENCNFIITKDNLLVADVSREFGAEGGRKVHDYSVFHDRLFMPPLSKLKGKVAVVATSGASNFHHWNYDILPRFLLLQKAGVFDKVDHFLVNYKGLRFQKEGLALLGIDDSRFINSANNYHFYVQADELYVPSLPEDLGTISPWVIEFLRNTFLRKNTLNAAHEKIYITRGTAPTRHFVNKTEVMQVLKERGYVDIVPEDYTTAELANVFANARSIVSIHGSGLSNLPFISEGTKVVDILAPFHQDPYYWMIVNQRSSTYIGLFAEGEHPADDVDLVRKKIDADLLIDITKLKQALDLAEPQP